MLLALDIRYSPQFGAMMCQGQYGVTAFFASRLTCTFVSKVRAGFIARRDVDFTRPVARGMVCVNKRGRERFIPDVV